MVSNTFKKQMFDPHSDDPFLLLLIMRHDSWATDQFLVNNNEDIVSNGNTFIGLPMTVKLPQEDGETVPTVQIEIDNVSIDLIDEIRSITSPIQAEVYGVLSSNPDIIETELKELEISNIEYNASKITATLVLNSFLSQNIPPENYSPSLFPGLF